MRYEGIWTALVTPFDRRGEIDRPVFDRLIERQVAAGVHGIVPCAVTGESPTYTADEWTWAVTRALELCRGTKTRVMVGANANCTRTAIELVSQAKRLGAESVLIVAPYFNKPNQAGIAHHFQSIFAAVPSIDVMAYHAPGRSGCGFSSATVIELSKQCERFIGLKDGHGDMDLQRQILEGVDRKRFSVMSGDDPTSFTAWALGASGSVSVASNLDPSALLSLWRSRSATDFERWYPLLSDLFLEPNPVPIKQLMAWKGLCAETLRLPLVPIADAGHGRDTLKQLKQSLERATG